MTVGFTPRSEILDGLVDTGPLGEKAVPVCLLLSFDNVEIVSGYFSSVTF